MPRLIDDLNALHDHYVESVNVAVGENDLDRADRLAAEYDEEAILMIALHEGRTDMLPLRRPAPRRLRPPHHDPPDHAPPPRRPEGQAAGPARAVGPDRSAPG